MSYRTYVNGHQLFGNNECYPEWVAFIKSQGIEVGEDGDYNGNITDVMGAVVAIEQIILRLAKEAEEEVIDENGKTLKCNKLFDFTWVYERILEDKDDKYGMELTDQMMSVMDYSYAFLSVAFIDACGNLIERVPNTYGKRSHAYKLKEGRVIHVKAD